MQKIYWNVVVTLKQNKRFILFDYVLFSKHRNCSHIVKRTVKRWHIGIFGIISSLNFTHET